MHPLYDEFNRRNPHVTTLQVQYGLSSPHSPPLASVSAPGPRLPDMRSKAVEPYQNDHTLQRRRLPSSSAAGAVTSAPLSRSRIASSSIPLTEAAWSAVTPHFCAGSANTSSGGHQGATYRHSRRFIGEPFITALSCAHKQGALIQGTRIQRYSEFLEQPYINPHGIFVILGVSHARRQLIPCPLGCIATKYRW